MNLSIVIPVYNNASTLVALVDRLLGVVGPKVVNLEILLVNDGSRDQSWRLIEGLCGKHSQVVGINFARNFGQHAGIRAGIQFATGDHLVLMDADLEDLPEHVPLMLNALKPGHDCVYTVVGQERRRLTSRIFHGMMARFTQSEVPVGVGTMRLFSRKFADALLRFPERRPVWGPIMHALGFRHVTLELPASGHRTGSSYNFVRRVKLAMDSLIANTSIPFTLLFYFASALFAASLAYATIVLAQYLFMASDAPSGITLIVFLLLTLFAFNFLFLAVMGLYIHRILVEALGRPHFVVSETLNSERDFLTDR